jgi:hypothetical protein
MKNMTTKNINVKNFRRKFLKVGEMIEFPSGKMLLNTLNSLDTVEEEIEEPEEPKVNDNEIDEDSEEDEENEENDDNQEDGNIPIMIIPCKKFKLPNKYPIKYFIKHYKCCKKCEITNNNDGNINGILPKAEIELEEITEEDDDLIDALNAYYATQRYVPCQKKDHSYIKIMNIQNNHNIYNGCIVLTWI